jgi:hypothetical protein
MDTQITLEIFMNLKQKDFLQIGTLDGNINICKEMTLYQHCQLEP